MRVLVRLSREMRLAGCERLSLGVESGAPEIIAKVDKGIYCETFANGAVQIGAGDFSFYVRLGYLIENGKLTRPIKDVNLIGNGLKFTDRGSVDLSIARIGNGGSDRVALRFDVADTGIGLPREEADKVFDAFFQLDSSVSRRYGGTGLGLAICKRLVTALGGEIGVDSEAGDGCHFWFTLTFGVINGIPSAQGLQMLQVWKAETGPYLSGCLDRISTVGSLSCCKSLHVGPRRKRGYGHTMP